jgi:hypothetical protein
MTTNKRSGAVPVAAVLALLPTVVPAAPSADELARAVQNPLATLISVPFQNNTNFDVGPRDGTQNVLNIQPVVPFAPSADWNVITRTILPIVSQPAGGAGTDRETGLGDIQFSAFLSPAGSGSLVWGFGAIAQLPTNTDDRLGNDNWGLGPTFVVLRVAPGSPWVYGVLLNNVWSVTDRAGAGAYNNFLAQPFVNYNLPGGRYLTTAPVVTASWRADAGDRWTVPVGGGVGKILRFGRLPVNAQVSGYTNVEKPESGADWQLRLQVQFLFPK